MQNGQRTAGPRVDDAICMTIIIQMRYDSSNAAEAVARRKLP